MLCLPWDSFLVSNDRPKIEQMFESRQEGAVENPELWRKILHVQRVNNGYQAFSGPDRPSSIVARCRNCACAPA